MSISLEWKKAKRTGLLPAFLGGGILAAAVPLVNMAVRSDRYLTQQGTPVQILMSANWQMMAMLNILLIVAGTCLLYHIEYADNAVQRMKSLPIPESSLFFGKVILTFFMIALVLAIEGGMILFCSWHWFEIGSGDRIGSGFGINLKAEFTIEFFQTFGYALLLILPCIVLSLLISQCCRNMWVSLGIGVVCVFTATMLPTDSFWLSLFPFAMPFQIFRCADEVRTMHFIYAAGVELTFFSLAELILIKVRRYFT